MQPSSDSKCFTEEGKPIIYDDMASRSRALCLHYFTSVIPNDISKNGEWICNKCKNTKRKSGGWTNLLNHARSCVGASYTEHFDALRKDDPNSMTPYVHRVGEAETEAFSWIEWVVMNNLPLRLVDDALTKKAFRYKSMTSKLLRAHILSLSMVVKESFKRNLPDKFSIVFDGWSEGTIHYIGISALYVRHTNRQHCTADDHEQQQVCNTVLSMRPLLCGEIKGMTAVDHVHHLLLVLESYGKTDANVLCLVGDNCSVNKTMSRLLKVPLIGCGAHKFNLAVNKWIANQPQLEQAIQRIASVMKKASTLKVSAQLRKLTALHTVKQNVTRWSSTYEMITRFIRIKDQLEAVTDLIPFMPSPLENDILKKGYVHLQSFQQVTLMLQKEGITFLRVREIFDTLLDDYPEMGGHLSADAEIVVDRVFERSVMKVSKGLTLTEEERHSISCLLLPVHDPTNPASPVSAATATGTAQQQEDLSYAQKLELRMKRRKTTNDNLLQHYVNLNVLAGTSVSCERLFSAAKFILTDLRKSMSPAVFEAILLLKVNRSEWDVNSVGRAMGRMAPAGAAVIATSINCNGFGHDVPQAEYDHDLCYED